MDWSTFVPTLLATFVGVVLSIGLSLLVRRVVNRRRDKEQAKETRKALLMELGANGKTLQEHIEVFREQTGQEHQELELTMLSRLRTSAYEIACQNNRVRLLDDVTLEKDLADLVEDWRFLNLLLQRREDVVINNLAYAPSPEFAKLSGVWDNLVKKQTAEFLGKTIAVHEKLKATK